MTPSLLHPVSPSPHTALAPTSPHTPCCPTLHPCVPPFSLTLSPLSPGIPGGEWPPPAPSRASAPVPGPWGAVCPACPSLARCFPGPFGRGALRRGGGARQPPGALHRAPRPGTHPARGRQGPQLPPHHRECLCLPWHHRFPSIPWERVMDRTGGTGSHVVVAGLPGGCSV